ncbi:tetratricopeptide repeat protein [Vibrio ostreicida]|uniref:Tetratricopeptide repeat protein n=1 Tax=Vibrio ostreicida TaxID=526588 RepID=A0ABT8BU44_9VIBR|nr:tetratricopeptide repeat protein [Vibrio ostreicida]MDN3610691.1 tetratricopeptide repeat protein [Vibrio ostreicida]NPD07311.1 tetratricopeptide repeat protein [Vibrio ostreicida]
MHIIRWKLLFGLLVLVLPLDIVASTVYSSAILNEASTLVDIVPQQSKQLTTSYLNQRELTDKPEQSPSAMSHDESDSRVRTPGSTIDALKILARAEFNLDNPSAALKHLNEAKTLTNTYQLPYLRLELQLLDIRLRWKIDGNAVVAEKALSAFEKSYSAIQTPEKLANNVNYQLTMLKGDIASATGDIARAEQRYQEVETYVEESNNKHITIAYHITLGQHYLAHKVYNKALSELLTSYWGAIEDTSGLQLAEVNRLLGQLFYERRVLDKATDHLSQAADFYDNYDHSPLLPPILKRMGDIYYRQGRYNLALVHYFNAIDHERAQNNINNVIDIRLSLAKTYLQLVNFPLAEQYLQRAEELLEYVTIPKLKAQALILEAGLASHQRHPKEVIAKATEALNIALEIKNISIEKNAYKMLTHGYELLGNYKTALHYLQQYNALATIQQQELNLINEDDFRQQKNIVEKTLHLVGQRETLQHIENEYHKYQKISFTLFITSALLFMFLLRRGHIMSVQKDQIDELNDNIYTHSRSGLKNLRMLNAKLPASLEASSHTFEKWHVGELIHEPLNDRLRFVMIDVPFLRNMYLQHGYSEGLKLEKSFGLFLKEKIQSPARIYHFSDANLLYIEPNSEDADAPEQIFLKTQEWVNEFAEKHSLSNIIRMGIADYPFLPRAYTAINDKELLDILLMSTSTARTLSIKEQSSQWVYLKAIENAPAASLATNNIRQACQHSIGQGLIKVHSSYQNEESIKKLLKGD